MAEYDELCTSIIFFRSNRLYYLIPYPRITDYFVTTTQNFNNIYGDGPALYGWYVYNSYPDMVTWDINITYANALNISDSVGPNHYRISDMSSYPFVYKALVGNFDIEVSRGHTSIGIYLKDPKSASNFIILFDNLTIRNVVNGNGSGLPYANSYSSVRIERIGATFYIYGLIQGAYTRITNVIRNDFGPIVEVGVMKHAYYNVNPTLYYIRSLNDVEAYISSLITLSSVLEELRPMIRLTETLAMSELYTVGLSKYLLDLLGFHTSLHVLLSALFMDYVYLSTNIIPNYEGPVSINENVFVSAHPTLIRAIIAELSGGISFTESFENIRDFYSFVWSYITLLDKPSFNTIFSDTPVSDRFSLSTSTVGGLGAIVQELFTLVDTVTYSFIVSLLLNSILDTEDQTQLAFSKTAEDSFGVSDAMLGDSFLEMYLDDSFNLHLRLKANGEVFQVWSFLTPSLYASIYTDFNFNSYAVLNDTTFGASELGVFRITQTDDQLNTGVRFNLFNMGTHRKKRIYRAYFGTISKETPAVRVITDDHDIIYQLVNGRANIAQGQQGRYWIFDLHQVEGVHFMEYVPIVLER
jgi:hypothetical protein